MLGGCECVGAFEGNSDVSAPFRVLLLWYELIASMNSHARFHSIWERCGIRDSTLISFAMPACCCFAVWIFELLCGVFERVWRK